MIIKLKLYKVTAWYDYTQKTDTFVNFVIAKNKNEAKSIVEQEVWTLSGMKIKNVKKVDITTAHLLCSINL